MWFSISTADEPPSKDGLSLLSLVGLGLGFQQRHYALFLLAAVTGATFWSLDALMTGYQHRYFIRLREIEYTAYLINRVPLSYKVPHSYKGDALREISAPRINMTWRFKGYPVKKGTDVPLPRRRSWWKRRRAWWKKRRRGENPVPWHDWRADEPKRQKAQDIYRDLRHCWRWLNVVLPHAVAVVLGVGLFTYAAVKAPGFTHPRL